MARKHAVTSWNLSCSPELGILRRFVAGYPGYGAKAPDGTRVIESTNYGPFNYADQVSCRSGGALQKQAVALPLSLRGAPQWLTHSERFINRLSFRT